jgi:hypothetical protein
MAGAPDGVVLQVCNELVFKWNLECAIFQVENTLYRQTRYHLSLKIGLFCDMFALPRGPGNVGEGDNDENPIFVRGISEETFSFVMNCLYGK